MADLEKPFPFHQAKAWEEQNALHNPVPDRHQGFCLLDTIKVERVVAEGERRQFAKIVPDQAKHGIEWPMHFTIPQFMNQVVNQWDVETSANNGRVVFRYFADCVTSKTKTIWNAVVNEHAKEDSDRTFENWQKCSRFYIEKMQNMSFIGDTICDKILHLKRPVTVSIIGHLDQIYEWISYITVGCVAIWMFQRNLRL